MQTRPLYRNLKFATNFAALRTMDELKALVDTLYNSEKLIGFDIETGYSGADAEGRAVNAYHPYQFITGFSITNSTTWARYVPVMHDYGDNLPVEQVWELVKPLLEEKRGVAHNIQFEAENLRQLDRKGHGPQITIPVSNWYDSMIEAYVLSDVPPMPISGALVEGEYVRRYIPPHHRTPDDFQRDDLKSFLLNLKSLTKFRYNYDQANIFSLFNGGKDLTAKQEKCIRFNTLPINSKVVHYACDDAYLCLQLHDDQYARILEDPYLPNVLDMEMQIAQILTEIREVGVTVDWEGLATHHNMLQGFLHEMRLATRRKFEEETGRSLVDLNLNSPQQIGNLLFGPKSEGGLELETTRVSKTSGKMSTDEKALTSLRKQSRAVDSLLKYRQCVKMGEWFKLWAPLKDQTFDQKIHPSFMQTRIQSGRFASANPNIQNVTKRWWFQNIDGSVAEVMKNGLLGKDYWTGNARDFVIASEGYQLLSFDYKSAEIQFLAALSQEASIIEAFYSGEDFHKWTASIVFDKHIDQVSKKERQSAKTVSFGLIYGQSVGAMAQQLGISKDEAQTIRDMYFARFPKLAKYFEEQNELVYTQNEVRTWLGRRATVWESMHDKSAVRSKAGRMSVNIPVQGGATGDYTKMAMIRVARGLKEKGWWNKEVRLLMNQHDSLVFEVHKSLDIEEVITFLTPLVQFSLAGIQGCFNQFESFPPMSVDWEVGKKWGSIADVEDREVLEATKLDIRLEQGATKLDLTTVCDVLVTNPGPIPVTIAFQDVKVPFKTSVKAHPDVLAKLKGGDPDIGILHKPGEIVTAKYGFEHTI